MDHFQRKFCNNVETYSINYSDAEIAILQVTACVTAIWLIACSIKLSKDTNVIYKKCTCNVIYKLSKLDLTFKKNYYQHVERELT